MARPARAGGREALAAAGLAPLVLEGREALALMNGTSCETAQAALLVLGAEALVAAAETAAALVIEVLGGNPEAFDARVHAARPHAGQAASAAHLRALLAGSRRLRDAAARGVPGERRRASGAGRLHAALRAAGARRGARHDRARARRVAVELNAVTDNPTFFPEDDVVLHAGNFHGQPVALAVDHLKVALAEVALFSERRLARLLDPATNGGLPPFLIRDRAGRAQRPDGAPVLRQLDGGRERRAGASRRRSARCRPTPTTRTSSAWGRSRCGRRAGCSRTRAAWSRSSCSRPPRRSTWSARDGPRRPGRARRTPPCARSCRRSSRTAPLGDDVERLVAAFDALAESAGRAPAGG